MLCYYITIKKKTNMIQNTENYLYIFAITLVGALAGFFIEKLILNIALAYAKRTTWKLDDIIIGSLRSIITCGLTILCFSVAVNYFPVSEKFRSLSNNISLSALILTFTFLGVRIFTKLIKSKTSDLSGTAPSTSILVNITRISIFLIGTMLVLQAFGISITPMLTALGVGGLAVALALQETLSNLFSGIQLIAAKNIRNGDYIQLDTGEKGFVMDITWRNTIIRELPNNLIIIPNSKLSSIIIINYNLPQAELAVLIDVGVSYASDLQLVEQLTIQVAREVLRLTPGGIKDFEPFIRYHTFADSSINFTVILRAAEFENQYLIKHEFVKALHATYKENNIEIPFPQRTLTFANSKTNLN